MGAPENPLTLADWRRRVAALYAESRRLHTQEPAAARRLFCERRDGLFREHLQTPLDVWQQARFSGLRYFPYDPDWCVMAQVDTAVPAHTYHATLPADGFFTFTRFARLQFTVRRSPFSLDMYWVQGYGGGLFLPFRDKTNGKETYGGGRYLYDGIKGADLGAGTDSVLLDFNFAYNPSCAYNDQWVCPLSPPENWLDTAVTAGEQIYQLTIKADSEK